MTQSHVQESATQRGYHLTGAEVRTIREMRADGHSIRETAESIGCARETVRKIAPGHISKVDNSRLRDAFLACGLSASEVAQRVGWKDANRLLRTLGLRDESRRRRRLIDWEVGANIAEAIGVAPWEVLDDV